MKDRTPTRPGRVLLTPEDGSAPFFATITRADEPTQNGDPLNKNTFLKDETADLFGMGRDAVPNGVFSFLGQYNLHWWKATQQGGEETYVQSKDRNAYPDFGTQGGVSYVYLGVPLQNSVDAKNTVVGAYGGTGKYGSSNRNSITFPFVPKFLVVVKDIQQLVNVANDYVNNIMIWVDGMIKDRVTTTADYRHYFRENNTVYWYSANADSQLNTSGTTYFYFAIG